MRKNKMMRTAAVLGVATMLTASVLSGTFAKYTTTATGEDSARVAKWGITMGNNGSSTFSDTYTGPDSGSTDATVKGTGENNSKVVAPGTHGEAIYKVSGAPETAYKITFTGDATNDVFLKKGLNYTYKTASTEATMKDVTYADKQSGSVSENYYPVNYSVKISYSGGNNDSVTPTLGAAKSGDSYLKTLGTAQTFETLDAAMKALNNTVVTYNTPNTEAGLEVEFKWAWAFDSTDSNAIKVGENVTSNDAYDTVLGDLAVSKNADLTVTPDTTTDADKNYSTEIKYKLSMTATQID